MSRFSQWCLVCFLFSRLVSHRSFFFFSALLRSLYSSHRCKTSWRCISFFLLFLSLIARNRCLIGVLCLISLAISWDLRLIFRLTIIGDLWLVIYLAIVLDL